MVFFIARLLERFRAQFALERLPTVFVVRLPAPPARLILQGQAAESCGEKVLAALNMPERKAAIRAGLGDLYFRNVRK
jgi:hypothetical protein